MTDSTKQCSIIWTDVDLTAHNLQVGDHVRGSTSTFSQKYMLSDEYAEYNSTIEGIVVHTEKDIYSVKIKTVDGVKNLVKFVGSTCLNPL